jgi:meso-butanediol dehydrogenase / (S,S)-butanediol dehydrogenase / diacetyl reductase
MPRRCRASPGLGQRVTPQHPVSVFETLSSDEELAVSTSIGRQSRGQVRDRLRDKVAVITGTAGGQGRDAALLFAKAGAGVIGCDVNESGNSETARLARSEGLTLDLSNVDASNPTAVREWIDGAAERYGGIDILYNNAAAVRLAPISQLTAQQWYDSIRLELDIVFFPTQVAWPHLIRRGGGSIINIGSVSGMRGTEHVGASAHAAAKGGVIGLTPQLAMEGAPHWIRVNTISPGPIWTPAAESAMAADPAFKEVYEGFPLLARIGQPIDIAFAALFLASDEASFITGAHLTVDGGWSAKGGLTRHEH